MPSEPTADRSLLLDIVSTLEDMGVQYVVVGAFAATFYGITRTTYDIDILVDMSERHIQRLSAVYPLPRYYADPVQMRDAVRRGIMFNIIDTSRGEKADLIPLGNSLHNRAVLARRVHIRLEAPGIAPIDAWCARADDVIIGKLMAWDEGRSRKHEMDIREMLVAHYLGANAPVGSHFDEAHVDEAARRLSAEARALWKAIVESAKQEAAQR